MLGKKRLIYFFISLCHEGKSIFQVKKTMLRHQQNSKRKIIKLHR